MPNISEAILVLREDYLVRHQLSSYQEINCGVCVEFAEEIEELINCEVISNDLFMDREDCDGWNGDNKDIWNQETLLEYLSMPPEPVTVHNLTQKIKGYHSWIYFEGKHFDAECPNGVENMFELPFFQRHLNREEITIDIPAHLKKHIYS